MSNDADTRTVVQNFLGSLGEGDPERTAAIFAEEVDWQLDWPAEGHPAVPWIRPRSTRADAADHFRSLATFHVPEKNQSEVTGIVVDGADAVILAVIRQTVAQTGVAYTARCAIHITVEGGLISRYHVYEDSLSVAEALTGARLGR
jgi:ketosteroid isomerase-like protein